LRSIAQLQFADKEVAVPSFRRRASVIDADSVDEPKHEPDRPADASQALALAEEAEAEAAEAEAEAAAARAKARAIRLRRQAAEAATVDINTETADVEAEPIDTVEADDDTADAGDGKEDEAEAPPVEEPVGERRGGRLGLILKILGAAIAAACTVVLITLSVVMVISHRHQAAEDQRRAEYTAAARQSAVTLMSLDFNKAKEDVQRIIDNSTGQFRDDFKNQADDFIKVAQDSKVITEVTVNATGVESMTDDTAVVLVSATSRVTNTAGAKQEPRSWRLSVNLRRDGGQIKMEKVEFVP
jgi:Mce-associated membrane protein